MTASMRGQVSGGIPLLVPLYDRIDLQMNRRAFSKPCVRIVQEVGFEKVRQQQSNLHDLPTVLLDGCLIAGLTANAQAKDLQQWTKCMQEVANVCPKIADLDLSRNLLERWEDVVGICTQLKRLNSLRLHGNRLMNLTVEQGDLELDPKSTLNGIKELGLDETFLSWREVGRSMGGSASSRSTHLPEQLNRR
ncbi:MAG: hypothetical protein M1815_000066 [Lichina confinis]|nr:MAG: hypothetical protein M1815_000066 [Lichina confinis]